MQLIIGGYAQGKLAYALKQINGEPYRVFDGKLPEMEQSKEPAAQETIVILYHLHLWIREQILCGEKPEEKLTALIKREQRLIVISDEIGNGIVPVDAFEREYRERTGRILVELADQADEVVRVICGIGQKIK